MKYTPRKIYLLGEKYSGTKPRGELQVYEQLKQYHLQHNTLFEDPQFVPSIADLGVGYREVQWLRPHDIVSNPHFALDGKKKCHINQGELGDCWFLAALADVTQDQELIDIIVPTGQSLSDDYAGIFHFRFWHYGKWIDIVIDDRLPTVDGKLIFMQQLPRSNEFWAALTEKAFAKLHRSYKNIDGGLISEALVEMTGGLNETYFSLSKHSHRIDFYDIMYTSLRKESYLGTGILSTNPATQRSNGLIAKHAYSITDLQKVETTRKKVKLLRLRNPWGHHEWNGDWSDTSELWHTVPSNVREKLLDVRDDGEFWMEFSDFLENFDYLDICHRNPNFFRKDESARWKTLITHCAWVVSVNNGGTPGSATFAMNPQFFLRINGPQPEVKHRIIVAVLQKNRREQGLDSLPLGFAVFKMNEVPSIGRLDSAAFKDELCVFLCTSEYQPQVTGHIDLPNGNYCLVPFTPETSENCDFLLRIYAEIDFDLGERDDNIMLIEKDQKSSINKKLNEPDGPAAATKTIQKMFSDQGKVQITWRELKSILDELLKLEGKEFSAEICRSMIALADTNLTGKLNFTEFKHLWESIGIWRGIFKVYDTDQSHGIGADELREALKKAHIKVNNRILQIILLRYANQDGQLEMEDFLHCCIKLNHMIAMYQRKEIKEMTLTEWLLDTLYS